MTSAELDDFLRSERTARVATVSADGSPHVVPLWYAWLDGAMYFTSLRRSRRNSDVESGSKVAVCVDGGEEYAELKGAVLYGVLEPAEQDPQLETVRTALGDKYFKGFPVPDTKSHRWLRLRPDRVASWDFRKIPAGRDPKTAG